MTDSPTTTTEPDADARERHIRESLRDEVRARLSVTLNRISAARTPPPGPLARPIAFNDAMVAALLAGRKTQTRRPLSPQPARLTRDGDGRVVPTDAAGRAVACPFGAAGDRLWVRQRWAHRNPAAKADGFVYAVNPAHAATAAVPVVPPRWNPARFMPRVACRLTLGVTAVRRERLTDLSPADAAAEGWTGESAGDPVSWFRSLWDSLYGQGPEAWANGPMVWVVEFRIVAAAPPA